MIGRRSLAKECWSLCGLSVAHQPHDVSILFPSLAWRWNRIDVSFGETTALIDRRQETTLTGLPGPTRSWHVSKLARMSLRRLKWATATSSLIQIWSMMRRCLKHLRCPVRATTSCVKRCTRWKPNCANCATTTAHGETSAASSSNNLKRSRLAAITHWRCRQSYGICSRLSTCSKPRSCDGTARRTVGGR